MASLVLTEVQPHSARITQIARQRLRTAPHRGLRSVECQCDDQGVLVLRGQLPSFYLKQLAQEAVGGIDGVVEVVNQTEVG